MASIGSAWSNRSELMNGGEHRKSAAVDGANGQAVRLFSDANDITRISGSGKSSFLRQSRFRNRSRHRIHNRSPEKRPRIKVRSFRTS
jgi:hypothetical protein